jgi:hypothetical protein
MNIHQRSDLEPRTTNLEQWAADFDFFPSEDISQLRNLPDVHSALMQSEYRKVPVIEDTLKKAMSVLDYVKKQVQFYCIGY